MADRPARILQILTNLQLGGAQLSAATICSELSRRGWDMHLAFSSKGGSLGEESEADPWLIDMMEAAGVKLHDVPAMVHRPGLGNDLRAVLDLRRLVRRLSPDIVHTHMSKAGLLGRLAAWLAGTPRIHSVRGWSFYSSRWWAVRALYVLLERLAARMTVAMLAVGSGVRDEGLRRRIGSAGQYRLVRSGFARPPAAKGASPRPEPLPAHGPLVGSVMELREHKAPADFVAAAATLARRDPAVAFVLVGSGPLLPGLREQVVRNGLGGRFLFLGRRTDLAELVPHFDVHVATSRYEGLPRAVVETMAAGVPNVASSLPGTRELIEDGRNGYLVAAGDVAAFADRIGRLLGDEAARRHMGSRARDTIGSDFWIEQVVAAHERIYAELLTRPARAPA